MNMCQNGLHDKDVVGTYEIRYRRNCEAFYLACNACRHAKMERLAEWKREFTKPDEVVVERLVRGAHSGQTNKAERWLAFVQLQERGLSIVDIAQRLDVEPRTVSRYRRKLREASGELGS